jgi:transcriptional regulator with XRE-family HTH domain
VGIVGELAQPTSTNATSSAATQETQSTINGAFGTWLARTRTTKNLSVPQLAKTADVSLVAIYNLESGRSLNPQAETRRRLEIALGTQVPDEVKNEATEEQEIKGLGSLQDFDPHDENDRPTAPGVYVFYDISERPIYVGKAENIKRRVEQHEDKFWFKRPIVVNGAYVQINDADLRHKVEQVLIKFLKSNAVINKQSVER